MDSNEQQFFWNYNNSFLEKWNTPTPEKDINNFGFGEFI